MMAVEECLSPEMLRQERGWKLFMLVPRMLLHRLIPKSRLVQRFEAFSRGELAALLTLSEACDTKTAISRRRQAGSDLERR